MKTTHLYTSDKDTPHQRVSIEMDGEVILKVSCNDQPLERRGVFAVHRQSVPTPEAAKAAKKDTRPHSIVCTIFQYGVCNC